MELQVPHSPMLEIVVALPTVMGFSSPGSPWSDFSCKSQVFRSLCTAECKGEVSGFILMKNNGFGNSGDLGNSFLHLPALPGGWGSANGGHHPSSECCRWEVGVGPAQALPGVLQRAPDAPKGSRGSQGFGGLSGAPVALRILEGPRGSGCSSGPHMSWRGVPGNPGCSQESGVFPRVWGAQQALGCSEGLPQGSGSEHPRMLWSPQDTAKLRDALRIPRCSKSPQKPQHAP